MTVWNGAMLRLLVLVLGVALLLGCEASDSDSNCADCNYANGDDGDWDAPTACDCGNPDSYCTAVGGSDPYPVPDGDTPAIDGCNDPEGGALGQPEADIYQVVGDRVFVLNQGGLFSIYETSDSGELAPAGSLRMPGVPVGMYVTGDTAIVFASHLFSEDERRLYFNSQVVFVDIAKSDQPYIKQTIPLTGIVRETRRRDEFVFVVSSVLDWEYACKESGLDKAAAKSVTEVTALSIKDPSNPVIADSLEIEGSHHAAYLGEDVVVMEEETGTQNPRTLKISCVDISDPNAGLIRIGEFERSGYNIDSSDIYVRDNHLFLVMDNRRLESFDLSGDLSGEPLGEIELESSGSSIVGAYFSESSLYYSGKRLFRISLLDPADPVIDYAGRGDAFCARIVEVNDDYLFGNCSASGSWWASLIDRSRLTVFNAVNSPHPEDYADMRSFGSFELDGGGRIHTIPMIGHDDDHNQVNRLHLFENVDGVWQNNWFADFPSPVLRGFLFDGRVVALLDGGVETLDPPGGGSGDWTESNEESEKIKDKQKSNYFPGPAGIYPSADSDWRTVCEACPVEEPPSGDPNTWPWEQCYAVQVESGENGQVSEVGKRIMIPGDLVALSDDRMFSLSRKYNGEFFINPWGRSDKGDTLGCTTEFQTLLFDGDRTRRLSRIPVFDDPNCLMMQGAYSGAASVPDETRRYSVEAVFFDRDDIVVVSLDTHAYEYEQCGNMTPTNVHHVLGVDRETGSLAYQYRLEGYTDFTIVEGGGILMIRAECFHGGYFYSFVYVSPDGREHAYPEKIFSTWAYWRYELKDVITALREGDTVSFTFRYDAPMQIEVSGE